MQRLRPADRKGVIVGTTELAKTSDESIGPMAFDITVETVEMTNFSGESSGQTASDEVDVADKMSAISMTEADQQQFPLK